MIEIVSGRFFGKAWCSIRSARSLNLASMILLGVITACGVNPSGTSASPHLLPVPTSSWRPGLPVLDARVVGTLEGGYQGSRYCVWLSTGSRRVPIVWPRGYHVRLHPLVLLNSRAAVVAKRGERIMAGGGFSPVEPSSRCMLGHKDAFYVMSGISVLASTQ